MEKKEIEVNEAQVENAINEAVAKMLEGNDIDMNCFKETIHESADDIATAIYNERMLPKKSIH